MPNTDSRQGDYSINNWDIHAIDPSEKNADWGYKIFIENKAYLKPAFGGWYPSFDADLIKQFAYANQPVERYKVMFDPQDKEAVYMGLNWNIASPIPALRNRVLNDLAQIPLYPKCKAVDNLANEQRDMDRLRLKVQPILDEKLAKLSAKIGYDQPIKSGFDKQVLKGATSSSDAMQSVQFDLQNDDELNIVFDGYYRQDVEMANEIAMETIMKYERWEELWKRLDEDNFDFGIYAYRDLIDQYTGLPTFQYFHPYKVFIQRSAYKDYSDSTMWYTPVPATLVDVLEQIGDELNDDDVKEIWKVCGKRKGYEWQMYNSQTWDWRRWNYNELRKVEADMYYFELKSQNTITYEGAQNKFGRKRVSKKDASYQPKGEGKTKENFHADCVYKGYYIEGVKKLYGWGLLKDMPRKKGEEQRTKFSLNIYRSSEKGTTELLIPHEDNFEVAYLKMQHALIKSLPKGYSFNWDALGEVDFGTGGKLRKEDLIQMYLQTGSTIHRTMDEAGDMIMANANAPHMLLENGLDPSVVHYMEVMNAEANFMAEACGISPTAGATNPNPKLLVGVQQAALQASMGARYSLMSAKKRGIEYGGEMLSMRLQDISKYNKETWERIKRMIGSVNSAIIESMDDLPLHEYTIYCEDTVTDEEVKAFKGLVMDAYSKQMLSFPEVSMIIPLSITNLKQTIRLMNLRVKKKEAEAKQMKMAEISGNQQTEQSINQVKLMIAKMQTDASKDVADANGKYLLLSTQLKEQSDMNKKLLSEITKLHLANEDKKHDHALTDKDNAQALNEIASQKNADMDTIKKQGEMDIEVAKNQPKPQNAAA